MAWLALYFSILTDAITVKFYALYDPHRVSLSTLSLDGGQTSYFSGMARYTGCTEVSWHEKIRHSVLPRDTGGDEYAPLKLKVFPTSPKHGAVVGSPHILRCENRRYGPGFIDVYECQQMKKSRIAREEVWTFTGCREGTRPMGEPRKWAYPRGTDKDGDKDGFKHLLDDDIEVEDL